ncbi:MAG: hypothetical protein HYT98_02435 [Candidatus Sungbacteria bacterium]|nr:hypothetical protein [Candidatus Sungbacteria bacterium]
MLAKYTVIGTFIFLGLTTEKLEGFVTALSRAKAAANIEFYFDWISPLIVALILVGLIALIDHISADNIYYPKNPPSPD